MVVLGDNGLRCRSGPRRLCRPELSLDFSDFLDSRFGRSEREAAEGAFASKGLVNVVTADHQACSCARQVRRLSAFVGVLDRAESENADVLRPPGKTSGPLGGRGAARFFDNQSELENCHARRRKDLLTNDLRLSLREVVELYSLRWQIELFFKELKSTLGFHQCSGGSRRWKADGPGVDSLYVLGVALLPRTRATWPERRGETLVASATDARLCQAVRLASQQSELHYLAKRLNTPEWNRQTQTPASQ